jgi:DNA-binding transcriptional LysR family regulator
MSSQPSVLFDEGFDLLIRAGDLPDSNLVARPIGSVEMVLAASPGYLAQFGEPKSPEDLEHHRWALPARVDNYLGSSPHWEFSRGKECRQVTVRNCVTIRDSVGLPESAAGGIVIVCIYRIALTQYIAAGHVKILMPDWTVPKRSVYAVFPNARAITPKAQALVDFFANLVAPARKPSPRR